MKQKFPLLKIIVLVAALVIAGFTVRPVAAADPSANQHWVGTWTTAPVAQPATGDATTSFNNKTLREIVYVSIGGQDIRLRLSNTFGQKLVNVGAVRVALRDKGAAVKPGTDRIVTFNGSGTVTLWPGATIVSDPVRMELPPRAALAVSIYLPGEVPATLPITFHGTAKQTNYISPAGAHTGTADMPVEATKQSWYFLTGVDVLAPRTTGGIVALGDSLTDANISTADTNSRWPDALADKLVAAGKPMGIMNVGTGGNRLLHYGTGESGLQRFDRDVLAQPGATHVIVLLGINDLRRRPNVTEVVTADDMIAGYQQLIVRAHAKGLKIYGGTLLPWEDETFTPGAYTPEGGEKRRKINAWMRASGAFDAVIDFDKVLQDPANPNRMLPKWDSGDRLHPGDAGYRYMGDSIDLKLFDR